MLRAGRWNIWRVRVAGIGFSVRFHLFRLSPANLRAWWGSLSLAWKLHLPIQLALLVVLPIAQVWVMGRFEEKMLDDIRERTYESATQSFLSLNAVMLSGAIPSHELKDIFLSKLAQQHGVFDFHVAHAPAVSTQYGIGTPAEQKADVLDREVISGGMSKTLILQGQHRSLRMIVPFKASADFYGTNCLQCHHVPEGTVLGSVSLTVDLEEEYAALSRFGALLAGGQVLLQLLLFLLIGWIIRSVTDTVVDLKWTMLEAHSSGDFSRRARVGGKDEIGQIAQVFNEFVGQIEALHRELSVKISTLETYRDRTEEELRIGSDIMTRITQTYSVSDPTVRQEISPAAHYSGDLILIARTPSNKLYILLADAVGHGLTAAMNLLPLGQVFDAMARKGFAISRLAEELNAKLNLLMPVDRFVGAALVSVDFRERVIEVWNGGLPPVLLIGTDGSQLHRWRSRNLPLGLLDKQSFSSEVEVFHYDRDCQLFLYSDGLPEAEAASGQQFGVDRIIESLGKSGCSERFDDLLRAMREFLGEAPAHDDVSLAMVNIQAENRDDVLACHWVPPPSVGADSQWRLAFSLGADELKYLDAVPMLTQIVSKVHAAEEHHSALFTILSELFNNALDHGILGLKSDIKDHVDGFEHYLKLREQGLKRLVSASISIEIERATVEGKYAVKISVRDSGQGFDHAGLIVRQRNLPEMAQHGRGLALVRALASSLEFRGRGNEVVVYYVCG